MVRAHGRRAGISSVDDLESDSVNTTQSYTDPSGTTHTGEVADFSDIAVPALLAHPLPFSNFDRSSGGGSVTITAEQIQLREPGDSGGESAAVVGDEQTEFDPSVSGRLRVDVSNITIDDSETARIEIGISDNPVLTNNFDADDFLGAEIRGNGNIKILTAEDGSIANSSFISKTNGYVSSLNYIQVSWDGSDTTLEVSDGSTTESTTLGDTYPTGETLHPRIAAVDSSDVAARNVDYDVDKITVS
jgi:hypothetical protein